jgi:hypothetical protein
MGMDKAPLRWADISIGSVTHTQHINDTTDTTEKLFENRNFSNYYFWSAEKVGPTADFAKTSILAKVSIFRCPSVFRGLSRNLGSEPRFPESWGNFGGRETPI